MGGGVLTICRERIVLCSSWPKCRPQDSERCWHVGGSTLRAEVKSAYSSAVSAASRMVFDLPSQRVP